MDAQEAKEILEWLASPTFAGLNVGKLAKVVQWLFEELHTLKAMNESLAERVAAQSELLSRRAERT